MVGEVGLEPTRLSELIYSQSASPNLHTRPYLFNLKAPTDFWFQQGLCIQTILNEISYVISFDLCERSYIYLYFHSYDELTVHN